MRLSNKGVRSECIATETVDTILTATKEVYTRIGQMEKAKSIFMV